MKQRNLIIGLGLLLLLVSSFTGDAPTDPAERATIVFYYRRNFLYGGIFTRNSFSLLINDRVVADALRPRTYFRIDVPAGPLTLRTKGNRIQLEDRQFRFIAKPNHTHYIEGVVEYDFLASYLYLVERSEEEALNRIKRLEFDEKALRKVD